ncbi:MAG TPA: class II fumarate hydratase [Steroidobacteraceae bacterium]|nr:class II fumarate hydratase [Steroidobacteraceae bacterium]
MTDGYRIERDSLGEVRIPDSAPWGPQTQRAVENFAIGGLPMPTSFVRALGLVKWAAARANRELGELPAELCDGIEAAALEVADGRHDDAFPVDVYQTGSGTSSNMNANEVIARLASARLGREVHPNDHVNRGQSSNDVIPTALHVSAALAVRYELVPALDHLRECIDARAQEFESIVKTGRTHLMDALPLTFGQELGAWRTQVDQSLERLHSAEPRIWQLAIGGTAIGTGLNAPAAFGPLVCEQLAQRTGIDFTTATDRFAALAGQDSAVELSGQTKTLAVTLMKIANDLRWMNSGPLAGLAEIELPALQPGSSIMPGKVNPVIPEAVAMAAARVIGNDVTIAVAGQSGAFQLNVMLPVIATTLLESLGLLARSARSLADQAIQGFTLNRARIEAALARNPILVTALNPVVGYDRAAQIAKRAYAEGRPIRDVAAEMTDLSADELDRLLDPAALTRGGVVSRK